MEETPIHPFDGSLERAKQDSNNYPNEAMADKVKLTPPTMWRYH